MRLRGIVAGCGVAIVTAGCRNARPSPAQTTVAVAQHSIFTDSAMHAEKCESVRPGEDWRKVCVPKDQGLEIRRKP